MSDYCSIDDVRMLLNVEDHVSDLHIQLLIDRAFRYSLTYGKKGTREQECAFIDELSRTRQNYNKV